MVWLEFRLFAGLFALAVLGWGYWKALRLDAENRRAIETRRLPVTVDDEGTVWTIKRRLIIKAGIAGLTAFSGWYTNYWLAHHEITVEGLGEGAVLVLISSVTGSGIAILISLQVVLDYFDRQRRTENRRLQQLAAERRPDFDPYAHGDES